MARHPCLAGIAFEVGAEFPDHERFLRFRQRAGVPVVRPAVVVFLVAVAAGLGAGVFVAGRELFPRFAADGGFRRLLPMTTDQQQQCDGGNPSNQSWTRNELWQSLHVSPTTLNCSLNALASPFFASSASFALSRSSCSASCLNSGSCCQTAGLASVFTLSGPLPAGKSAPRFRLTP